MNNTPLPAGAMRLRNGQAQRRFFLGAMVACGCALGWQAPAYAQQSPVPSLAPATAPSPSAEPTEPKRVAAPPATVTPSDPDRASRQVSRQPPAQVWTPQPSQPSQSNLRPQNADAEAMRELLDLPIDELLSLQVHTISLFPETVLTTPGNISVIRAQDWRRWGSRITTDVLQYEPSVMTYPTFLGGKGIAVRGYGQFTSVRGIATLLDGVPVNDVLFGTAQYERERTSLAVLDRIELARGPGSVTYGTDAFHGTFALHSYYREQDEADGEAAVADGPFYRAVARASRQVTPWLRADVAADVNGNHDARQPYWDTRSFEGADHRVQRFRRNAHSDRTALLKLHNRRSANTHYELALHRNDLNVRHAAGGGSTFGHIDKDESSNRSHFSLARLTLSQKLGRDLALEGRAYHWDFARDIVFETGTANNQWQHSQQRTGGEVTLRYQPSNLGMRAVLAASFDRHHVSRSARRTVTLDRAPLERMRSQDDQGFTRRIGSAFGEVLFDLWADYLAASIGGRYDYYSDFGHRLTPRGALVAHPSKSSSVKLVYGRAFRAPTTTSIFGSTDIRGKNGLAPEEIDSVEAIAQLALDNWLVELTGFQTWWRKGIAVQPSGDPMFANEWANIGRSSSRGLEQKTTYRTHRGQAVLAASLVESHNDVNMDRYSAFPTLIVSARGYYDVFRGTTLFAGARLARGMTEAPHAGSKSLPTYVRLDVGAQVPISSSWAGQLNVRNATGYQPRTPSVVGSPSGYYEPGISVMLTLRGCQPTCGGGGVW